MRLNPHSFLWFNDARRDLAHAARLLRRNPVLTITATLSLAIGIGANTTIFTVANALLFQPPAGVAESPVSWTSAAAGEELASAPARIRTISTSVSAPAPSKPSTRTRGFLRR